MTLKLSALPHTWLIDLDGVVAPHNGHLAAEGDTLLPGAEAFWAAIPEGDTIILMSARAEQYRQASLAFLAAQGLRVDIALFGLPTGERILINDAKPSGLKTAHAVNLARDKGLGGVVVEIDPDL
jgi:hypothetical protein